MTTRRLAAILAADVVGFSSMMEKDEEGTLRRVKALQREVIEPKVKDRGGRLVKTTGDGFLCEFGSPVEAVRCALEVQDATKPNGGSDLLLRMGINLGDIIVEPDGDIYGEGVNVAARLEQLAEPGNIWLSEEIHRHVSGKIDRFFEERGEQQVKNIARPVRVYALAGAGTQQHPRPLPLPDKPSIAVLPFTNMSGDPEQGYFADGIAEDLLTALSRVRWLFVIARNSSFAFKGRSADVKEIGERLGVRYVLEGSTRRSGARVRVTAQLVDALTGAHLWAERYDRDLTDIFELQDDITQHVVSAIEPSIRLAEITRARTKRPEDLTAYDLYLRALPEFHLFSERGFRSAERLLRRALEHDPEYAEAWAALADSLARLVLGGWAEDWDLTAQEACRCAEKAVASDPENGTVLASAAQTLVMMGGRFEEAVGLAARALELHPASATVRTHVGWVYVLVGNHPAALEHFEAARRMSPLDPRGYLILNGIAASHFFARRFDETEQWTARALEKWPSHPVVLRYRAAALSHLGRTEEASKTVSELLRVQPNASITRLRRHAYGKQAMTELLVDGLRVAGLPE
jgi:adenylate cyclase